MIKEKGILFNQEMVKCINAGWKTQTRRPVSNKVLEKYYAYDEWCDAVMPTDIPCSRTYEKEFFMDKHIFGNADQLWVRETWNYTHYVTEREYLHCNYYESDQYREIPEKIGGEPIDPICYYMATYKEMDERDKEYNLEIATWRPSLHMPRWASRINLLVKRVWVERIQDISANDCVKEGIYPVTNPSYYNPDDCIEKTDEEIIDEFSILWDDVYKSQGKGWDKNPWVWCCEFEVKK